jgi:hypothetical protein
VSDFTEFARDLLRRCSIRAACADCGNTNLDELAITGRGKLICRQDIGNIREACTVKRDGWQVLDARGRVVDRGPGVTLHVAGTYGGS